MLKAWRTKNRFNLSQAAAFLGLNGASQVFYLERGETFPSPETIGRIEGATGGEVTIADHWRAWRQAHPFEVTKFRAAGRSAAKEHRPPAKPKSRRKTTWPKK